MSVTQSWPETQSRGGRTAEFTARTGPSGTVITASGELDAANADHFADFVELHIRPDKRVILDLLAWNSLLPPAFRHCIGSMSTCSGAGADWDLVPGPVVHRLLRICDPDGALPTTMLVTGTGNEGREHTVPQGPLQLVAQSR